jgi:hypothetical protein
LGLAVLVPWVRNSECRRGGLESQMQIVAVGLSSVVETIGTDSKKEIKLPKQPETGGENVV